MAQQDILIGDTGGDLVNKTKNNFDELYYAKNHVVNHNITGNNSTVVAGDNNKIEGDDSVAAGNSNQIIKWNARALNPLYSQAFGFQNDVYGYAGYAHGHGCVVDSWFGMALGNSSMCTGNDSVAFGGQAVTGRRKYYPIAWGTDALHGEPGGIKPFVIIDPSEGDCTSYFPNTIIYDPANPGILKWAQHPYCALFLGEMKPLFFIIIKSIYTAGVGTKIWYDNTISLTNYAILSSYAPFINGNSMSATGKNTNAAGMGAWAEGYYTRAWGYGGSHAEGERTQADGEASHAEGYYTKATNRASHSEGQNTLASGEGAHAEGETCIASGAFSHAMGTESLADEQNQCAHANGKFSTIGDAQYSRLVRKKDATGDSYFALLEVDQNKSYAAETLVVGRQYSSTNGSIGESCAYKLNWLVTRGHDMVFASSGVDVVTNTITVPEKIISGTRLKIEYDANLPTGFNPTYLVYAIYVDDTHIQIEYNVGGGAIDLLTTGLGDHYFFKFDIVAMPPTLIGRTFKDDGDVVGDGVTTGIRAEIYSVVNGGIVFLYVYGIATRSIKWVATNHFTEVSA